MLNSVLERIGIVAMAFVAFLALFPYYGADTDSPQNFSVFNNRVPAGPDGGPWLAAGVGLVTLVVLELVRRRVHRSLGVEWVAYARSQGDTGLMLERFGEGARRSVSLAEEESRALNHDYLGTEHLLLGMLAEGRGVAALALTELGVSADASRDEVSRVVGRGPSPTDGPKLPFTPRAKKVLELALREAAQLSDRSIGTEHLLLGVLREGQGVAVQVLAALDVEPGRLRSTVLRLREQQPPSLTVEGRLDAIDSTLQQILRQQDAIMRAVNRLVDPPPEGT